MALSGLQADADRHVRQRRSEPIANAASGRDFRPVRLLHACAGRRYGAVNAEPARASQRLGQTRSAGCGVGHETAAGAHSQSGGPDGMSRARDGAGPASERRPGERARAHCLLAHHLTEQLLASRTPLATHSVTATYDRAPTTAITFPRSPASSLPSLAVLPRPPSALRLPPVLPCPDLSSTQDRRRSAHVRLTGLLGWLETRLVRACPVQQPVADCSRQRSTHSFILRSWMT
jgi:hypothetical protein